MTLDAWRGVSASGYRRARPECPAIMSEPVACAKPQSSVWGPPLQTTASAQNTNSCGCERPYAQRQRTIRNRARRLLRITVDHDSARHSETRQMVHRRRRQRSRGPKPPRGRDFVRVSPMAQEPRKRGVFGNRSVVGASSGELGEWVAAVVCGDQVAEVGEQRALLPTAGRCCGEGAFGESLAIV